MSKIKAFTVVLGNILFAFLLGKGVESLTGQWQLGLAVFSIYPVIGLLIMKLNEGEKI